MTRYLLILPAVLAGCGQFASLDRTPPGGASVSAPATATATAPTAPPVLTGPATSVASLDTVSEADKATARQAAAAAPGGGALGTVTVALGDPTDGGLWVKSELVASDTPGTVRTGNGEAIAVTLRPLGGAGGPQISLSALQALGLPLGGLHSVTLARAG